MNKKNEIALQGGEIIIFQTPAEETLEYILSVLTMNLIGTLKRGHNIYAQNLP